ncbi:hypothetical protein ABPG75_009246 [Micractinium tetrahymenae]
MGSGGSGNGGGGASVLPTTLLLAIPAAELHKVSHGQQSLLARGQLSVDVVDAPAQPHQQQQQPAAPAAALQQGSLYPQLYQGKADAAADPASSEAGIVLTVGGVSWELQPARQTLKVGDLSYVFSTSERGTYYTVTLASGSDEEAVALLEAVLAGASIYRESQVLLSDAQVAAGDAALSRALYRSSLAQGVHVSSRMLASGLKAAAGLASAGISRGAAAMAVRQQAAGVPVEVSPTTKKRLQQTEAVASTAAKAANGAVSGLAWAGAKLADGVLWLAGANKPRSKEAGTLRELSHAALAGFTEVWEAMEDAGRLVLLSARDGVADVVGKKYGPDAAQASMHSMNAAGHSADAMLAARKLGVRTIAKSVAKGTAKGVIRQWGGSGSGSAGSAASSGSGGAIAGA